MFYEAAWVLYLLRTSAAGMLNKRPLPKGNSLPPNLRVKPNLDYTVQAGELCGKLRTPCEPHADHVQFAGMANSGKTLRAAYELAEGHDQAS